MTQLTKAAESNQLLTPDEGLHMHRDFLPEQFPLPRFLNLCPWDPQPYEGSPCKSDRRNARNLTLNHRLRNRPHALVSSIRSPKSWQKPSLYRNSGRFRASTASDSVGPEHRDGPDIPVSVQLLWISRHGSRRCHRQRYVPPTGKVIRSGSLGAEHVGRAGFGSTDWSVRRPDRWLAVDHLGVGVDKCADAALGVLLPPGDQCLEHPLQASQTDASEPSEFLSPIRSRAQTLERHRRRSLLRDDCPALGSLLPGAHLSPPKRVHSLDLHVDLRMVGNLPHCLHRSIRLRPRRSRTRISWTSVRRNPCHSAVCRLVPLDRVEEFQRRLPPPTGEAVHPANGGLLVDPLKSIRIRMGRKT